MARKPSHLGSKRNPSPVGNASTSLASIGSMGGVTVSFTLLRSRFPVRVQVRFLVGSPEGGHHARCMSPTYVARAGPCRKPEGFRLPLPRTFPGLVAGDL